VINPLVTEFWRLLLLLLLGLMFGLLVDAPGTWLLLALLGFCGWHGYQLIRYTHWLVGKKTTAIPDVGGVWGELYYQIYRLRERNRKTKRRMTRYLARFQESTAALPDAVVVLTADITIEWFNDAARQLLHLHRSKDTGQRIDNLIRHPDFVDYLGGGDYSEPLQLQSPIHDEQVLLVYIVPYGDNQRLVVVRDITHLSRLEQMRRDFVANVSHELCTPLTVISGYIETLAADFEVDSGGEATLTSPKMDKASLDAMREVQLQADRMQNIVHDLLLLSRLEGKRNVAKRDVVNVAALVAEIHKEVQSLAANRHEIVIEVQSGLWLKGSDRELHSAFLNLVTNAIKYTPATERITIKWSLAADGQGAVFEVSDTGAGIARQYIPRLTERFFRVDEGRSREQGGTGLGLAIVKHVLIRHQARLEIESELGKGSHFYCVFPSDRLIEQQDQ
jgi:two-component system phosphate regulon sensor histidine kinase PhoR